MQLHLIRYNTTEMIADSNNYDVLNTTFENEDGNVWKVGF